MDPSYDAVRRQLTKSRVKSIPRRDQLLVQRLVELLSGRNLGMELVAARGSLLARLAEAAGACAGYASSKQPRLGTLRTLLEPLAAAIEQAQVLDDSPERSDAGNALSQVVPGPSVGGAVASVEAALRALHRLLVPAYIEDLLRRFSELHPEPEMWSPDEQGLFEEIAGEVVGAFIASDVSPAMATRKLIGALHREDQSERVRAAVVEILRQPNRPYIVLVPVETNKPLGASQTLGVEFIDDPAAWAAGARPGLRDSWVGHLRRHLNGLPVRGVRLDVSATDPYAAGAQALSRLAEVLDAYHAKTPALVTQIRRPYLVLSKARLGRTIQPYETQAWQEVRPAKHVGDARLASLARFLTLSRSVKCRV